MENIISNLSVWGVIAMLFTAFRVSMTIFQAATFDRGLRVGKIILHKFRLFFAVEYKSLIALIISISVLFFVTNGTNSMNATLSSTLTGVFWLFILLMGASLGLAMYLEELMSKIQESSRIQKILYVVFCTNMPISVGTILLGISSNILLFWHYGDLFASNDTLIMAFLSVMMVAFSLVQISYKLWKHSTQYAPMPYQNLLISHERTDILLATLMSIVVLSANIPQNNIKNDIISNDTHSIIFGLFWGGIILFSSSLIKTAKILGFIQTNIWQNVSLKLVLNVFLAFSAWVSVKHFVPTFWIESYKEISHTTIFFVMILGLITSFVNDLNNSFVHQISSKNQIIQHIISIFALLLSVSAFLYAYMQAELLGVMLVLVAMLANLLTELKPIATKNK